MNNYIGVKSHLDTLWDHSSLKRDALMFTQIAIPNLHTVLNTIKKSLDLYEENKWIVNELEWLFDKGLIFSPKLFIMPIEKLFMIKDFWEYASSLDVDFDAIRNYDAIPNYDPSSLELLREEIEKGNYNINKQQLALDYQKVTHFFKNINMLMDFSVRVSSIELRESCQMQAYPILAHDLQSLETRQPSNYQNSPATKSDILNVVIKALPIPHDSTSWEQIFEYRSDPESKGKFLALRNWINEATQGKLTQLEIEQKLEYQIDQYQRHLKLHRIKTNVGAIETIIVSSAEFLEDLVKFKWGKLAKSLFLFKHRRIALIEGELTAPGNEVAYIVKTKKAFSL